MRPAGRGTGEGALRRHGATRRMTLFAQILKGLKGGSCQAGPRGSLLAPSAWGPPARGPPSQCPGRRATAWGRGRAPGLGSRPASGEPRLRTPWLQTAGPPRFTQPAPFPSPALASPPVSWTPSDPRLMALSEGFDEVRDSRGPGSRDGPSMSAATISRESLPLGTPVTRWH